MEDPKDKIGPRVKPRELFVARDDNPFVALKDLIIAFGETPEMAVNNLFEGHKHRDQLERFFSRAKQVAPQKPSLTMDDIVAEEFRRTASDARAAAAGAPSQLSHLENASPQALRRAAERLDKCAEQLSPRPQIRLVQSRNSLKSK